MVVGSVQSGKTANFLGLITKARDVGYKFIVILSGANNDLRQQTQQRTDHGYVGLKTNVLQSDVKEENRLGILRRRLYSGKYQTPTTATIDSIDGDFSTSMAKRLDRYILQKEDFNSYVFVCKKHRTVLTNLIKWLYSLQQCKNPNGAAGFEKIPETQRPIIVSSPTIIEDKVQFDAIVGRNIFRFTNYQSLFSDVITRLSSQGRLCLSEEIVASSQQIYELMKAANLNIDSTTYQKIIKAELTYYEQLKTKNEKEIRDYLNNNLQNFDIEISTSINELIITKTLINRWFPEKNNQTNVKSYAASLKAAGVTENIITVIRNSFTARLEEGFKWHFNTLYVVAIKK